MYYNYLPPIWPDTLVRKNTYVKKKDKHIADEAQNEMDVYLTLTRSTLVD